MPHYWRFFRTGGLDQVQLRTADDLAALDELDPKLWVALGCPVKGLEMDERTLALVDSDGDGRIRVPEIVAAAQWTVQRLKQPNDILQPAETLALASIDSSTAEGAAIVAAGQLVLRNLGAPQADTVTLAAFADPKNLFNPEQVNGDGVIPPEAAPDDDTKTLITDISDCFGTTKGRSGGAGVTPDHVEKFFTELEAYAAWAESGAAGESRPFGDGTDAAYTALAAVRAKIDDYFARCRLIAYDPRSEPAAARPAEDYLPLAAGTLSLSPAADTLTHANPATPPPPRAGTGAAPYGIAPAHAISAPAQGLASGAGAAPNPLLPTANEQLASFPIALPGPAKPLPLRSGVNPIWAGALFAFRDATVAPAYGTSKDFLTEAEWQALAGKFSGYETWFGKKPGGKVAGLNLARAKEILGGKGRAGLMNLIARDAELGPGFEAQADLERLIRYRRDLPTLLRNFVNFADFYDRSKLAIFQAGVLYLDSRSCELCVRVEDPAAHSAMATMSKACIAYIDCRRPGGATLKVAACFTQGDTDYLFVGRNGIFVDRAGHDWDATIIKLIDNPISIRQAFLAPYKKLVRFIEEQVAKRAAASDVGAASVLSEAASSGQPATPAAGGAPAVHKFDVGTVAALGVAVGGITGAIGAIIGAIVGHGSWIPIMILCIILAISGPSMIIAWLKLRERTLGPILEASGWAINGRVKINMPLGRVLTDRAQLPAGSERQLRDPYRDKAEFWRWFFFWLILAAIAAGLITQAVRHRWPFHPPPAPSSAPATPAKK